METIFNDVRGIPSKAAFNAIKASVHPVMGKLRKGISEKTALQASILNLREASDDIEDLDFLKFFPNLDTLFVSSKNLSNVDGLRYLTKATCIELSSHWPKSIDISVLSSCKHLEELLIDCNLFGSDTKPSSPRNTDVKGWNVLKDLPKIQYLSIPDMGITDIGFLKNMPSLEDVELAGNPIANLTPLHGHPTLKELDLSGCGIEDISVLSSIPNLESVFLTGNRIKDFSPLKGMKNLSSVVADDNGLSDSEIEKWKNELQHIEELDFEPLEEV